MKISVDGGGLCAKVRSQFGNYVVTKNLIQALQSYDQKNQYEIYSFCQKPVFIKKSKQFRYRNLQPRFLWSSVRLSFEEQIKRKDYFLAINQAAPLMTPAKIISFSHGLSFHFFPKLYPDSYKQLAKQLDQMLRRSYKIIVSSIKVKNELLLINESIDTKIKVIPYGVPFDMRNDQSRVKSKKLKNKNKFFLVVGMDHPIKNHKILPTDKYRFVIVSNISRIKLKSLYQKATALVTTSLYESFNLPVLEALSQGCPVIGMKSAIIPELAPYVNICENKADLIYQLENANNRLNVVNIKEINRIFSWKNYSKQLLQIFE